MAANLYNRSKHPALMVRVKAVRDKTGDRILPAIYSDNYLALMPGEMVGVRIEVAGADTRGERPRIVVEGFNVGKVKQVWSDISALSVPLRWMMKFHPLLCTPGFPG